MTTPKDMTMAEVKEKIEAAMSKGNTGQALYWTRVMRVMEMEGITTRGVDKRLIRR